MLAGVQWTLSRSKFMIIVVYSDQLVVSIRIDIYWCWEGSTSHRQRFIFARFGPGYRINPLLASPLLYDILDICVESL
jgi:hypothetical protein